MPFSTFSCILLFAATVALTPTASSGLTHQLTLTNGTGSSIFILDNQPNLEGEELGSITEICNSGVWVRYPGIDYDFLESGDGEIRVIPYLDYACRTSKVQVGSVRRVGVLSDASVASATFYTETAFRGLELMTASDIPSLDFGIVSAITINKNIELFREPNYEGESYCFNMNPFCAGPICWMYYFEDSTGSPFPPQEARSLKLGCILPPTPIPTN